MPADPVVSPMSEAVYILNAFQSKPRYHAYGRIKQLGLAAGSGDVTKCGLLLYDGAKDYADAFLRRDHADLFAAPCSICFRAAGEGYT